MNARVLFRGVACFIIVATVSFIVLRGSIDFINPSFIIISEKKLIFISSFFIILSFIFVVFSDFKMAFLSMLSVTVCISFGSSDSYIPRYGPLFEEELDIKIENRNNPFLYYTDEIRSIKKSSKDISSLWSNLVEFSNSLGFDGVDPERAMLIVAAFYEYGNYKSSGGCLGDSDEAQIDRADFNFQMYMDFNIGCCNDYSYMLGSFLDYLDYESYIVEMPSHIANVFESDGKFHYIDSNTTIFLKDAWRYDDNILIMDREKNYIYPNPNVTVKLERPDIWAFQSSLLYMFAQRIHFMNDEMRIIPMSEIYADVPSISPH